LIILELIAGTLIYLAWRYRRRSDSDRTADIKGHRGLEIAWSVIPSVLLLGLFIWGFTGFISASVPPKDALQIRVRAQKWIWSFSYPDAGIVTDELVVPVGKPVQVTLTSADVIHSFFIPAFRVKKDVLPNRYTVVWFQPSEIGEYDLKCAEYCGRDHSRMRAKVRVVSQQAYQDWLDSGGGMGGEGMPLAKIGEKLITRFGCVACHTTDGTRKVGPSFKGVFGHEVQLSDGTTVIADENYIRESIMDPQAKLVAGFGPLMPTFKGLCSDANVEAIIEYLKTLGAESGDHGDGQEGSK
jgi:cytochrome c oxidase subunit 2